MREKQAMASLDGNLENKNDPGEKFKILGQAKLGKFGGLLLNSLKCGLVFF